MNSSNDYATWFILSGGDPTGTIRTMFDMAAKIHISPMSLCLMTAVGLDGLTRVALLNVGYDAKTLDLIFPEPMKYEEE